MSRVITTFSPERLKRLRKSKGLTQEELAKKIGVTNVAVFYWENYYREPRIIHLASLANALEVNINEFFDEGAA